MTWFRFIGAGPLGRFVRFRSSHAGISLYFLSFTPSRNLVWMLLPLAGCLSQCACITFVPLCMTLPGTS